MGWTVYALLALLTALFLSWRLLASVDFGYPLWYQWLAIDQHIEIYAPQNRYRQHFQLTTQTERMRLFSALVTAIHQAGENLSTLYYHNPLGRPVAALLTHPEIVHLQDVARLVGHLMIVGWVALSSWGLATFVLLRRGIKLPSLAKLLLRVFISLGAIAVIILLLGPVKVFYYLHEWIFPDNHQWFFYYQESLMTTLLKAPDIFAPIALSLVISSMVFFTIILIIVKKLTLTRN